MGGVVFFYKPVRMLHRFTRSRQFCRQTSKALNFTERATYSNTQRTFGFARATNAACRSFYPASFNVISCVPFEQHGSTRFYASNSDDFPPHILLGMPALSPTMTQGTLVKWLKQPGDEVSVGDAIAEIETDKAQLNWDSIVDGFFVKSFVEEQTEGIPVGKVLALLAEDKDDIEAFENFEPPESVDEDGSPEESKKEEPKKETPKKQESKSEPKKESGRIFASPAAKALAQQKAIDLSQVTGSGPNGRIVVDDVENFTGAPKETHITTSTTATKSSAGDYEDIPNSSIRKVIASRLTESKQTIPHYYLTIDFCVDKLQKIRSDLNQRGDGKYKLSINDFIIKASAMTMRKVPEVNSSWAEKYIRRFNNVNINVAVNSDAGLFTPIVHNTDNKGLIDISTSVRELAGKAKAGKLTPDELQVGTFTISNLGMFGIKQFAAVINPPQACILAVGGIEQRVIPDGDSWKTADFMTCTLSCDHRVVDGALGAKWLQEFKARMEDPITLLL